VSELKKSALESLLVLNAVDTFGSVRIKKLLDFFGSAENVLQADSRALSQAGFLTPAICQRLKEAKRRFDPAKEIALAQKKGVTILTVYDAGYPLLLKEIYDPPVVLYIKGDLRECDHNALGVVGSRGASYYGLSCAREFASYFARCGLTVVSGMARGIDTAAHRAVLDNKGRTLAVLGSGLLDIYPPENEKLFDEIAEKGAVVSEFPLNTRPLAQNFPVRNRVISGLARGVLVVEASEKSGALITARFALEQNREVYAIPGKVSSATSAGTHALIKQGAKIVTSPQEILEDMRFNFELSASGPTELPGLGVDLDPQESGVVAVLSDEPMGLDDIAGAAGSTASELLAVLTRLELKKIVKQLPGKTFVKTT
jgi:DNA processing protein